MGLTVSNQASNLYKQYTLQNSDTYKNNAVDSAKVSKEDYNVSNLTNALDALASTDQVDLNSVGNVDSYASSLYQTSQLSDYSTLTAKNQTASELLPGSTEDGLSKIYSLIAPDKTETSNFLQGVIEKAEAKAESDTSSSVTSTSDTDASSSVDSYKQYLSAADTGSLLDTSV